MDRIGQSTPQNLRLGETSLHNIKCIKLYFRLLASHFGSGDKSGGIDCPIRCTGKKVIAGYVVDELGAQLFLTAHIRRPCHERMHLLLQLP